MLENLFNDARRAAKSSDRGRLESRGVWHATVTQPTVEFFLHTTPVEGYKTTGPFIG